MLKRLISIFTTVILALTTGSQTAYESPSQENMSMDPVTTQINVPSEPLLLTPEIGSFFYGELSGDTYDDPDADMWCSFEESPDAPNFGFEAWQSPGCSKWCHIIDFSNQATASSELASASGRYCAVNVVSENRELA